jgi:hypothetical protein
MDVNKAINFSELIAAPLAAAIEADAIAATTSAEFIKNYGFEKSDQGNGYGELAMVTFSYSRPNTVTGESETVEVQVPALSLIPLPLLQVNNVEFNFSLEVLLSEKNTEAGPSLHQEEDPDEAPPPAMPDFKARLSPNTGESSKQGSKALSSNMAIKVEMERADVPGGLINLMTLFQDSTSTRIRPTDPPAIPTASTAKTTGDSQPESTTDDPATTPGDTDSPGPPESGETLTEALLGPGK